MIKRLFFYGWLIGRYNDGIRTLENKYYEADSLKELYDQMDKDRPILDRHYVYKIDEKYTCRQRIEVLNEP